MLINQDPPPGKHWATRSDVYTCPYHRKHPGENYAGCTCSAYYHNVLVDDLAEKETGQPYKMILNKPGQKEKGET